MPGYRGNDEIRRLEKRFKFKFDKSLGQNFLNDGQVLADITEGCQAGPDDLILEIGPGMGFLTMALAEKAGKVLAIEIDDRLIPILQQNLAFYNNIEIIHQDVLKADLKALIQEHRQLPDGRRLSNVKVVGNLPYYITTPILMGLLEARIEAESITVMIQKEVADKILAAPGDKAYCVLTLMLAYYGNATLIRDVPAELFVPRPKVDSAVVTLTLLPGHGVQTEDEALLFRVIKAGFSQRRKTLSNALEGGGFAKDRVQQALQEAGIDSKRRAETLSLAEFARIADQLSKL